MKNNNENTKTVIILKNNNKIRVFIAIIAAVLLIITVFCGCQKDVAPASDNTATTAPSSAQLPTAAPATELSDWDRATLIWVPTTVLDFELRVKPGINYEMTPGDDHDYSFLSDDGNTVNLHIQSLDYEKYFENLLAFYRSKHPEKLLVNYSTQAVIVVYDSTCTEICTKLNYEHCLTTTGPSVESISSLFSNVMIRVEGNDYVPFVLDEGFVEA